MEKYSRLSRISEEKAQDLLLELKEEMSTINKKIQNVIENEKSELIKKERDDIEKNFNKKNKERQQELKEIRKSLKILKGTVKHINRIRLSQKSKESKNSKTRRSKNMF
jgi:hypothetical protein